MNLALSIYLPDLFINYVVTKNGLLIKLYQHLHSPLCLKLTIFLFFFLKTFYCYSFGGNGVLVNLPNKDITNEK